MTKKDVPTNSNMVRDLEEMKQLGKEMEKIKKLKELEKENKVSDPIQCV